ncbi:hypothetical protein CCACVL1_28910 [Corchorus capsularis]|uniref:Uncharacterized protein n=1 Tax=Corchorus capsularis TaxID=210143 RepID=A0A1R3G4P3_COCAP|nr:hypothetical protein CCACVL1_28910 [Corchorus capsularis]
MACKRQMKTRGRNRGKPMPCNPSQRMELHVIGESDLMEKGFAGDITTILGQLGVNFLVLQKRLYG